MPAIPGGPNHPTTYPPPETKARGYGTSTGRKADPGAVLAQTLRLNELERQVRAMQAEDAIAGQMTYLEATLAGALLALPPEDPSAPRPLSSAERRYREDLEWDFARRQARMMGR